jgi:hypothetical protein
MSATQTSNFLECLVYGPVYGLDYGVLGLKCHARETRLEETSFE